MVDLENLTYHDKFRRPSQAPLQKRFSEIAEILVRDGYRRFHVLGNGKVGGWSGVLIVELVILGVAALAKYMFFDKRR
jgi:hypothetical protein